MTDEQWDRVAVLVPVVRAGGRPRTLDMRAVVDAIRYLHSTACPWRDLPPHYPNPSSVWTYYDRWRRDGTWAKISAALEEGGG